MNFRRSTTVLVAVLACACAAFAAPALASSGGASVNAGVPASSTAGTTLWTSHGALVRRAHVFHGFVPRRYAGQSVVVEGKPHSGGWQVVARVRAGSRGGFRTAWTPQHLGRYTFRALPAGQAGVASAAGTAPSVHVTVFLPATATYYGPGFYGKRTACGQTLSRSILGVAHRWLPCGTKVALLYHGRTITVPVIDRGPFSNFASWDLTSATATRLGMTGTSRLGAVSFRGSR